MNTFFNFISSLDTFQWNVARWPVPDVLNGPDNGEENVPK